MNFQWQILRRTFSTINNRPPPIQASEYQKRRSQLLKLLTKNSSSSSSNNSGQQSPSPLVVLVATGKTFFSPNVPNIYRQCSNFRYLSGIHSLEDASSKLIIGGEETVLFRAQKTQHEILWDGEPIADEEIRKISGIDRILPLQEFDVYLAGNLKSSQQIHAHLKDFEGDKDTMGILKHLKVPLKAYNDELDVLRWIKSSAEADIMRHTCQIGSRAINATISDSKFVPNESQIVGQMEYEVRKRGANFLAYPPVIAAGNRANTIHYIASNRAIQRDDCILMDAGCDYDGYISDITRNFPVNGRFSDPQRVLYEALNDLQSKLLNYVKNVRPLRLDHLYFYMLNEMGKILRKISFFKNSTMSENELLHECDELCPHHVSHYLGMDIHDSPTMSRAIDLLPGVVFTVEPGIYIRKGRETVREEFHGIGFRIEDDILLTDSGAENLTRECVRNLPDIEALMRN